MTMSLAVLFAAIFVVLFASLLFVFHPEYESGVVGVVGLGMLAVAAISRLDHLIERADEAVVSPRALIAWVGLALFFGQLAWRFLRRCRPPRGEGWRGTTRSQG